MRPRLISITAVVAAAFFLGGCNRAGTEASFAVQGKYYDTCACAVSCSCGDNVSLPTEGRCDGVIVLHIDKGTVRGTNMDGLNLAVVLRTPQGEKVGDAFDIKGETDLLTLYLDDKATPKQREVMPQLLAGMLGTRQMKGFRPPQWAPLKLDVQGDIARFQIAGGQKLSFEIENVDLDKTLPGVPRSDPGNRITLTNVAPFPWIHGVTQGRSHAFHYEDLGVKWDYQNRNAFFGTFAVSGPIPAPAAAHPA